MNSRPPSPLPRVALDISGKPGLPGKSGLGFPRPAMVDYGNDSCVIHT